jgi:hypothetical protein
MSEVQRRDFKPKRQPTLPVLILDPGALEQVRLCLETMHPKLGPSLIMLDRSSAPDLAQLPQKGRTVSAGFDQTKLQVVISALA